MEGATEKIFKYYFAGSIRIAMRENGVLTWLLADHLGSTNVTADGTDNLLTSLKYTAFAVYATPERSLHPGVFPGERSLRVGEVLRRTTKPPA